MAESRVHLFRRFWGVRDGFYCGHGRRHGRQHMPPPTYRAPQSVDRLDILGRKHDPSRYRVPHVHGRGAKERYLNLALDGGCAALVAERGPHLGTRSRPSHAPGAARLYALSPGAKRFGHAFGDCRAHHAARTATARLWAYSRLRTNFLASFVSIHFPESKISGSTITRAMRAWIVSTFTSRSEEHT